ncbi:mitochondrial carrier [Neoconidiobolus thromboides FSU 785]|nr:mitochondrial carrier [Neoconidiobolus thromboides FSU 785]
MSENLVHALSGAGGGIISLFLTYPLNTVSQRLQVQRSSSSAPYKGTYDAIAKIFKEEGLNGLYAGLDSALFGIALTNAVYYYFYEWTKAGFEKANRRKTVTTFETMVSGAVAGAATVLITNPIWVVNTRMSTRKQSIEESDDSPKQKEKQISSYQAFKNIIEEDGVLALWQGVTPALILVSNPIIQYTVFEQSKNALEKFRKLGSLDFFFLGAIGKLIATFITYPYIVIKSRMQLRQSNTDESLRYESVWDGMRKIIRNEGVSGLYKGIQSKLLQSILNAAFLFMAKEALFDYTPLFYTTFVMSL